VFVGDIGPDVTVDDLREAFNTDDMAVTDARIVMDQQSGRTKGYGFVTFADNVSTSRALVKNGEILKGRKMRVNWAATTKDQQNRGIVGYPPPESYMPPVRNEFQATLHTMAACDGLDYNWYLRLPTEVQTGILRVALEAPGAKVVWVGNLDKTTTRMFLKESTNLEHDIAPLFAPYGLVEEVTMVSNNGYAFISYLFLYSSLI
jgi:RNA recognition motif-containing protein